MVKNYFELFDLPVRFDIDRDELARKHRELIRLWHPDRFAQGSDQERRLAVEMSANLNDGLKVLREPVDRARYFLSLNGVSTDEETDTSMDVAFLLEQMAWRERLEDSGGDQAVIEALAAEVEALAARKEESLTRMLTAEGTDGFSAARKLVREMQFLRRFAHELDEAQTGVL
ncbi:MAG TPA: Fe-S protein assembly co-chaperone HscB [Acidiferrobacter sp.]|nr:Fe-S protein assembly co-chaperone HscB [Acidiferrobacter sp.]